MKVNPHLLSSHHFVTSAQSTALVVCGSDVDPDFLGQLLEWNPLVISFQEAAERLLSMNARIDVLVTPTGTTGIRFPYPVECWQESRLAERLMAVLEAGAAGSLAIAGCPEESVEEWVDRFDGLFTGLAVYTGKSRCIAIRAGTEFRKWFPAGSRFGIRPLSGAVVEGTIERDGAGRITSEDGWVRVKASENVIFLEIH